MIKLIHKCAEIMLDDTALHDILSME